MPRRVHVALRTFFNSFSPVRLPVLCLILTQIDTFCPQRAIADTTVNSITVLFTHNADERPEHRVIYIRGAHRSANAPNCAMWGINPTSGYMFPVPQTGSSCLPEGDLLSSRAGRTMLRHGECYISISGTSLELEGRRSLIFTLVRAFEFSLAVDPCQVQKMPVILHRPLLSRKGGLESQLPLLVALRNAHRTI
ncbi:hypothetical protein BC628DRAFT_674699 [Trametes gibbosa]|nr:hypothetical protein BC628DRAFT_674699 [Trametes gibbosa]